MGTFHNDTHELHGITVLLETHDGRSIIGRFHEQTADGPLLLDCDVCEEAAKREGFLSAALKFGHWPRHKHLVVPQAEVSSLRRLSEVQ